MTVVERKISRLYLKFIGLQPINLIVHSDIPVFTG